MSLASRLLLQKEKDLYFKAGFVERPDGSFVYQKKVAGKSRNAAAIRDYGRRTRHLAYSVSISASSVSKSEYALTFMRSSSARALVRWLYGRVIFQKIS